MFGVVGLSHRTAPIAIRERLALNPRTLPEVLSRFAQLPAVGEVVLLSTCNRVEAYVAPPRRLADEGAQQAATQAVGQALAEIGGAEVADHLGLRTGIDALMHLFRVASSLDSLVVGEPQILGQLKSAYDLAQQTGTTGPLLTKAMHRALHVGKRVRTETAIGRGQVSVSSIAVDLAQQIFGELRGRVALMIGAGEMAEAAAKLIVKSGGRLIVVNRSPERAAKLAAEVGGIPRAWGDLDFSLVDADIVITSTSSAHPIITRDIMKRASKARRGRSIFLIDIAVPRDVEPAVNELDNVFLYDIDDLSQAVAKSLEGRASEAIRAEAIVSHEVRSFESWSKERALAPVIVGLRARTRAVLVTELERTLGQKLKHLPESDRDALRKMMDAATNKLCHHPSTKLKELASQGRANEYIDAVTQVFDIPEIDPNALDIPEETRTSRPGTSASPKQPSRPRTKSS